MTTPIDPDADALIERLPEGVTSMRRSTRCVKLCSLRPPQLPTPNGLPASR
jgi:hypothetical protein